MLEGESDDAWKVFDTAWNAYDKYLNESLEGASARADQGWLKIDQSMQQIAAIAQERLKAFQRPDIRLVEPVEPITLGARLHRLVHRNGAMSQ